MKLTFYTPSYKNAEVCTVGNVSNFGNLMLSKLILKKK